MENRVIEGTVNSSYEAVISIPLRGPGGQAREIEAVIDTGYSGFLVLPPHSLYVEVEHGGRVVIEARR